MPVLALFRDYLYFGEFNADGIKKQWSISICISSTDWCSWDKLFSRCFKLAIFKGQMIQQFMYEFESIYTTAQRTILDSKTLLDASNGYSLWLSSSISFIVKINNQKAFRAFRTFDMLHFSVSTLHLFHLHRNNSLLIPIIGSRCYCCAMIQLLVQFQGCKSGCDD